MRSRNKLIFDGGVEYVSSINDTGPFDILPKHSNFITLIKEVVILGRKPVKSKDVGKGEDKYLIRNGILRVVEDEIDIYVNLSAKKLEEV